MSILNTLSRWSRAGAKPRGWVGVYRAGAQRLLAAYADDGAAAKPRVQLAPVFDAEDPSVDMLDWQQRHHRGARANVLFNSVDYRLLPVTTPPVPGTERLQALRWQLKDLVDFPADEACIDCIDVPGPTLGAPSRQVFAVASEPAKVRDWMRRYRQRKLALGAIDIPEMAMRNLSVLADAGHAHAYLHMGLHSTRLILVWQRELCSFRQFDTGARKLASADDELRTALLDRLALEIQRSTDAFSRHFHGADLRHVWVSSVREPRELIDSLSSWLTQTVRELVLSEHVDLVGDGAVVDVDRGLDFTLAIGAALRRQEH